MVLSLNIGSVGPTDEKQNKVWDVIIVGGGPAGVSAALYTARGNLDTLVLYRAEADGALGITSNIENYPGVPGPISGYELLKLMRKQAKSFGAEFEKATVIGANLKSDVKEIYTEDGRVYKGKTVLIATGALERSSKIPGEDKFLGRGVSYCAICDAHFYQGKPVIVVGDSEYALEEAELLSRFASKVTLVVPTKRIKAPSEMVRQMETKENVEILLGRRPLEIVGKDSVEGLKVKCPSGDERVIPSEGVFVFLGGSKPSVNWLMGQVELNEKGGIKVNPETMETSVPGVFAAGDVLGQRYKQAVIAAAQGVIAALNIDKFLNKRGDVKIQW
ncbi:MAG: thioredoxin reductase [Gammaproteobacteria bacterium]|nr:MAG: thioredoxin reductase [Gammaproteobacteria bacterium]